MKRRVFALVGFALVVAISVLLGVVAGTGRADPNLPDVSPHRHFILSPTGEMIPVGPQICEHPELQHAFNEFHNNLHVAGSASIGPAAPGLHNGAGAEIIARPCSFHP